jgi:hypothetical protein
MTMALLPDIDLTLGIPTAIVTIMRTLPTASLVAADQLRNVGASLLDAVSNRRLLVSQQDLTPGLDYGDAARLNSYTGLDGVYVGLGPTWQQAAR